MSYWWVLAGVIFFLGICCRFLLPSLLGSRKESSDIEECFRRMHKKNDCGAAGNFMFLASVLLAVILLVIKAIQHLR